jgi:hypothetical protein
VDSLSSSHTEYGYGEPDDILVDSVRPIIDAGLAELVETDHRITDRSGLGRLRAARASNFGAARLFYSKSAWGREFQSGASESSRLPAFVVVASGRHRIDCQ